MFNNDNEGERELVLGNKQLLAIFFVATLLCGVFFAMGYVVGGNSAKAGAEAVASDTAPAPVSEGKPQPDQPLPDQPTPPPAQTADNTLPGDPAAAVPSAEPRIADNPSASGTQPVTPVKPAVAASKAAAPDTGVALTVPESGASYWQVAAEARPDAEVLVKQLRDRQFPAILAKSSKPELFEILVGPYRSPLSLADAKKKLIDLSFGDVFLHKQ